MDDDDDDVDDYDNDSSDVCKQREILAELFSEHYFLYPLTIKSGPPLFLPLLTCISALSTRKRLFIDSVPALVFLTLAVII